MSFKNISTGYPAFLFHPSNSEQDIKNWELSSKEETIHVKYILGRKRNAW